MIMTRFMELRKRRGLMIALIAVNIGVPAIFLIVRLVAHAVAPHSYGPAGGYSMFEGLIAGLMYIFGFIVAATLGCTAGAVDLTEGMFRHLVITGRSRLALYFARIPAGLASSSPWSRRASSSSARCASRPRPTKLSFDGVNVPAGLSQPALDRWASAHAERGHLRLQLPRGPGVEPAAARRDLWWAIDRAAAGVRSPGPRTGGR